MERFIWEKIMQPLNERKLSFPTPTRMAANNMICIYLFSGAGENLENTMTAYHQ